MPAELPGDNPRNIWLNQPAEANSMSLKLLQLRSRELHARTRRGMLRTLGAPLAVGLVYLIGRKQFGELPPSLQIVWACALAWSVAGLFFLNRGIWSAATPDHVGLSAGLEFCRRELQRQRGLVRGSLLWSFGPVLLALGTFVFALSIAARGQGILPKGLPFLILVGAWIVAYFLIRLREQHGLQREIGELDDLEKSNRP